MKKLIFILLMLSMLAVGQQHMMSVLASQSLWDYEGTMTVGFNSETFESNTYDYYGYNSGNYGSMSPTNPQVSGYSEAQIIVFVVGTDSNEDTCGVLSVSNLDSITPVKVCNVIEIDGVEFTGFPFFGGISINSNPFPASGETCTIKMK
jgi:hypothetical protein